MRWWREVPRLMPCVTAPVVRSMTVKNNASSAPGRKCGHPWLTFGSSTSVNGSASPPPAGIRHKPAESPVPTTIVSSLPQLAPMGPPSISPIRTAEPPAIGAR